MKNSGAVKAMQTRLKSLGYLTGTADGSFGDATKAAVIAFQTANGLKADGKAGTSTLNRLYSDAAIAASSMPTATASTSVDGYTTLSEGDTGTAVRNLQKALKTRVTIPAAWTANTARQRRQQSSRSSRRRACVWTARQGPRPSVRCSPPPAARIHPSTPRSGR